MNQNELRERVNSFSQWHYQFDLDGVKTPIFDPGHVNRHEQRRRYFFDPLVQLVGGSLKGSRVLDLGCNAGYWSLQAIQNDCDFVLGIDGRQMHIDQANLVFDVKGVEKSRYEFRRANLFDFDLSSYAPFDVVLALGLLYHISKPVELLEKIERINRDILVIDTELSMAQGRWLEVRHEELGEPRNAVDYETVFLPTRRVVLDLVKQFGYSGVILKPDISDYTGMEIYRRGKRRAFICSKHTPLIGLKADSLNSPISVRHLGKQTVGLIRGLARDSGSSTN